MQPLKVAAETPLMAVVRIEPASDRSPPEGSGVNADFHHSPRLMVHG
jgi:hypothetical protein